MSRFLASKIIITRYCARVKSISQDIEHIWFFRQDAQKSAETFVDFSFHLPLDKGKRCRTQDGDVPIHPYGYHKTPTSNPCRAGACSRRKQHAPPENNRLAPTPRLRFCEHIFLNIVHNSAFSRKRRNHKKTALHDGELFSCLITHCRSLP